MSQTADLMARAQRALDDAQRIAAAGIHAVAAREGYIAALHAAQAFVFERQGSAPKTHSGLHSAFARLASAEPGLGGEAGRMLSRLYEFKDTVDYGERETIPCEEALAAVSAAADFVRRIARILDAAA